MVRVWFGYRHHSHTTLTQRVWQQQSCMYVCVYMVWLGLYVCIWLVITLAWYHSTQHTERARESSVWYITSIHVSLIHHSTGKRQQHRAVGRITSNNTWSEFRFCTRMFLLLNPKVHSSNQTFYPSLLSHV